MRYSFRFVLVLPVVSFLGLLVGKGVLACGFSGALVFVNVVMLAPLIISLILNRGRCLITLLFNLSVGTSLVVQSFDHLKYARLKYARDYNLILVFFIVFPFLCALFSLLPNRKTL